MLSPMEYYGGEFDVNGEIKNGGAQYQTPNQIPKESASALIFFRVFGVLGIIIVGIFAVVILPSWLVGAAIIGAVIAIPAWLVLRSSASLKRAESGRYERLVSEYGETIAQRIVEGMVWIGQTEDQVRESAGQPIAIDTTTTEGRRTEVWKYGHAGGNRYAGRITLVNGAVTKWTIKQ